MVQPVLAEPSSDKTSAKKELKPKYYTWVDAQGNVHNTLISTPENSQDDSKADDKSINPEDYASEEEYQQKLQDRPDGEKPFFTWTDAEGVIRSDVRPDVMIEFSATELVYDAVFAPPFRLPEYVTEGLCCDSYQDLFVTNIEFHGSASYKVDDSTIGFKTQQGEMEASYFTLPDLVSREVLSIKAYEVDESSKFEIIALAENFKPIYLESKIEGRFAEQTWKDLAYKEALLEVSDAEIKHLIVFVKNQQGKAETDYILSVNRDSKLSD